MSILEGTYFSQREIRGNNYPKETAWIESKTEINSQPPGQKGRGYAISIVIRVGNEAFGTDCSTFIAVFKAFSWQSVVRALGVNTSLMSSILPPLPSKTFFSVSESDRNKLFY